MTKILVVRLNPDTFVDFAWHKNCEFGDTVKIGKGHEEDKFFLRIDDSEQVAEIELADFAESLSGQEGIVASYEWSEI